MNINFNIEKLDKLLCDFYTVTGLTISVWDADFNELSYQPAQMRSFCRTIKSTEKGKHACFLSDKSVCNACSKTGKPTFHHCHAGLIDVAFPIKYKEQIMGYIMFGQIADKNDAQMKPILEKLETHLGVSSDELLSRYKELIRYDEKIINSAAAILKLATRYLWLSDYIEVGYNETATKIDEYIKNHISEEISVYTLCSKFNISKKRLYEIAHRQFGASIGEYICSVRIKEAKNLLCSTDYPIKQIAYMVGVKDYNYFTKFFKSRTGTSPLKYRKAFSLNIHSHYTEIDTI